MINKIKTLEKFNINPDNLSDGSHKRIVITCDYCGLDTENSYKNYINSKRNTVIDKDCCMKCRPLKAKECNKSRDRTKEREAGNLKRKITCLRKYGVEHVGQLPEIKNKICESFQSKTNEEKQEIIDKRNKTTFEKHGKSVRDIITEKMMEKYGVNYYPPTIETKEKRDQTNLEKYGTKHPAQLEEIQQQIRETNLKKYGVEYYTQTEEFKKIVSESSSNQTEETKQKRINTNLEKFGCPNPLQNKEIKNKMIQTKINKGLINNFEGKTDNEWANEKNISRTYVGQIIKKYGLEGLKTFEKGITDIEQSVKNILIKNNLEFIYNPILYNNIGKHKRGDFQIGNLILEANGIYWHSDEQKPKSYHKEKRDFYLENKYDCLFFNSDEIIFKPAIVESIILNKLKLNTIRIFARKCEIEEVDNTTAKLFFQNNHLMGNGSGKTFGLFYENKLVSCMQLRKKKDGFEISRYCNLLNISVIGGFSKLLNYSIKKLNINQIITFIDLRYGSGDYLENFGFIKETEYLSFKWTDNKITFHRMTFPGDTGKDHGMTKIWDCGQAKWVKYIK